MLKALGMSIGDYTLLIYVILFFADNSLFQISLFPSMLWLSAQSPCVVDWRVVLVSRFLALSPLPLLTQLRLLWPHFLKRCLNWTSRSIQSSKRLFCVKGLKISLWVVRVSVARIQLRYVPDFVSGGIMDQLTICCGAEGSALLIDCRFHVYIWESIVT